MLREEKTAIERLTEVYLVEESMMKQKARDKHLNRGDCNSGYFYTFAKLIE